MPAIIGLAAIARSGKDTVASMLLEYPKVAAYALADPLKAGCQALFGLTDEESWADDLKEKKIQLWGMSPRQLFQRVGTEWLRDHNPEHWLLRADRQLNHPQSTSHPPLTADLASESSFIWLAVQAFWGLNYEQTWLPEQRDRLDPFWSLTPNEMFSIVITKLQKDFSQYEEKRKTLPITPPLIKATNTIGKSVFVIKDIRFENEAEFWRKHNGEIWHIVRNGAKKVNPHSSEYGIKTLPSDKIIENNGSLEDLREKVERAWAGIHAE